MMTMEDDAAKKKKLELSYASVESLCLIYGLLIRREVFLRTCLSVSQQDS